MTVFLHHPAINTHPPAGNENRVITLVDPLHLCTAFGVLAFGVFGVWHTRCIQLVRK